MKVIRVNLKVPEDLNKLLERFQAHFWAETGEKKTKEEVFLHALEAYIAAAYSLSKDETLIDVKESHGK